MSVYQNVGKGGAVRSMEQVGRASEVDQDVGLRRFRAHRPCSSRPSPGQATSPGTPRSLAFARKGFKSRAILRVEGDQLD
jgi:hypothetical protein